MPKQFEIVFLEEAYDYLKSIERKHYEKILFNLRKAQEGIDSELFKKFSNDIWEFRTLFQGIQHRILAFWEKKNGLETLVICTHGFVKKRSKVPENEILKAEKIKKKYFENKNLR